MMTKKYQSGGTVRSTAKRREGPIIDGGPKAAPVAPMAKRPPRMRDLISPEERRELDAPLTADEVRRMSEGYKKGGMIKKKAGGVVKKAKGGMIRGCK